MRNDAEAKEAVANAGQAVRSEYLIGTIRPMTAIPVSITTSGSSQMSRKFMFMPGMAIYSR